MPKSKNSSKNKQSLLSYAGKLMPTAGYILIEPTDSQTKTAGGIYLPENASGEKPQKGKVVAIGGDEILDSGKTRKTPVKIGQMVVYKKWGGSEYKEATNEYLFVKFEDILAIIK